MTKGSNQPPSRGRKRRPPPDQPTQQPCISLWLAGDDFTIMRVASSVSYAETPPPTGQPLAYAWPAVAAHVQTIAEAVRASGQPMTALIPSFGPADVPQMCVCVPLERKHIVCTLTPARSPTVASAALAASQRNAGLVRLLDTLAIAILETDAQHRVIYLNAQFIALSGYYLGEFLPFTSTEAHPFWRTADGNEPLRWCDLPIARVWQSNGTVDDIIVGRTLPSGETVTFLARAQPVRDASGRIISAIVALIDVTEQRETERLTLKHAAQMDAVIDSIQDGIIIYDATGTPLRFNPAALRIFGWEEAGIDPLTLSNEERTAWYKLRDVNDQPLKPQKYPLARTLAGESPPPVEFSVEHTDGTRTFIRAFSLPLRDPATGTIFGSVGIFHNMTERYVLDRMRDQFFNLASHELRTPLTSLLLSNYILNRRLTRLGVSDLVQMNADMALQMKRMERLITNMLDLTALTGGTFLIHPRRADLARVVRDAVQEQRAVSKRTITLAGAAEPLLLEFDVERITQVMVNLLMNALTYSHAPATVDVELTMLDEDALHWARVVVRDAGVGIPAAVLATIFQRFEISSINATEEATDPFSGLGFGLYLAHAIITKHGGRIWAESELGQGSTFGFELPME
jgi:PAS domain S-box-containing protein